MINWQPNWLPNWQLPSKMKLRSSKTKLFCETVCKNEASKLKNKPFCETSLKNVETLDLRITIRFSAFHMDAVSKSLRSRHSVVRILRTATSRSHPKLSVFNDIDFRIAFAPQPGANFAELNFKKSSGMPCFNDFDFRTVLASQRGANFAEFNFKKCSDHGSF